MEAPAVQRNQKELSTLQRALLRVLAAGFTLWGGTLRFRPDAETRDLMAAPPPTAVGVLWHNRLFAAPAFFRRHFRRRELAALISASRDGAWLAGLLHRIGIEPVRGSQHRRGVQAVREMREHLSRGRDLMITPDGSRGPCYSMKAGAARLAWQADCPVVLIAFCYRRAFRLKTWDRFFIPWPGSIVDVRIRHIKSLKSIGIEDPETARTYLETALIELSGDV